MEYILAVCLAIFCMLFFAVFVMKNIIKRISQNSKKYFIDKLQEYDYIIDEKNKEIEELQKRINILQEEEDMKKDVEEYKKNKEKVEKLMMQNEREDNEEKIIYDIPTPKFRQEEFFKSYKELKKQFYVNSKEVLEKFLEEHKEDNSKKYEELKEIKNYFDKETIYECVTLTPTEQYEVINKTLKDKEKKLVDLDKYNKNEFSILKFMENLDTKIKEEDPTIYVYVSNNELNYDNLSDRIKTVIYQNMSEGIIIQYHNKMYDYSI